MGEHAVSTKSNPPRRKFLAGAALGTGVAAGFPMIARAQQPITLRWQSTWPAKDIFHEYALDYAKKVN
ncbi:MAG: twin-arginine translocation signal domain-containing protein, partial [bacterium]